MLWGIKGRESHDGRRHQNVWYELAAVLCSLLPVDSDHPEDYIRCGSCVQWTDCVDCIRDELLAAVQVFLCAIKTLLSTLVAHEQAASSRVQLQQQLAYLTEAESADYTHPIHTVVSRWDVSLSPFLWPFSRWTWVSRYQNVSILDFIEAKDDEVVVQLELWASQIVTTNEPAPRFLQAGCPSCRPTNSVKACMFEFYLCNFIKSRNTKAVNWQYVRYVFTRSQQRMPAIVFLVCQ